MAIPDEKEEHCEEEEPERSEEFNRFDELAKKLMRVKKKEIPETQKRPDSEIHIDTPQSHEHTEDSSSGD